MENDSPNLFDSEPLPVKLTVAGGTDDVLTELIEEINTNDASVDAERGVDVDDEMESDEVRNAVVAEYQTDDEDEEDDCVADGSVDQSAAQPGAGSPRTKAKDGHKGLPPGRVKLIMKMDPDVNIVAGDAVFLLTKATVTNSHEYVQIKRILL